MSSSTMIIKLSSVLYKNPKASSFFLFSNFCISCKAFYIFFLFGIQQILKGIVSTFKTKSINYIYEKSLFPYSVLRLLLSNFTTFCINIPRLELITVAVKFYIVAINEIAVPAILGGIIFYTKI